MKRHYSLMGCFVILAVMVIGSRAYADETSQFNQMIQSIHSHRAKIAAELGLDPRIMIRPQATSYYDDLVDHYEQVRIMSDFIDKGIR